MTTSIMLPPPHAPNRPAGPSGRNGPGHGRDFASTLHAALEKERDRPERGASPGRTAKGSTAHRGSADAAATAGTAPGNAAPSGTASGGPVPSDPASDAPGPGMPAAVGAEPGIASGQDPTTGALDGSISLVQVAQLVAGPPAGAVSVLDAAPAAKPSTDDAAPHDQRAQVLDLDAPRAGDALRVAGAGVPTTPGPVTTAPAPVGVAPTAPGTAGVATTKIATGAVEVAAASTGAAADQLGSEATSGETKAGEAKAGETTSGVTTSGVTKAGETKAGETKPGEAKAGALDAPAWVTTRVDEATAPTTRTAATAPAGATGAGIGVVPTQTVPSEAAPTPAPSSAPNAPTPPLAEQLGVHLAALRGAGAGEHVLTLRVDPESIGPVRVVAHIGRDGVRIELLGATDQARQALQAALPDLRRDLVAAGLPADLGLGNGRGSSLLGHGAGSGTGTDDRAPGGDADGGSPGTGPAADARPGDRTPHSPTSDRLVGLDLLV